MWTLVLTPAARVKTPRGHSDVIVRPDLNSSMHSPVQVRQKNQMMMMLLVLFYCYAFNQKNKKNNFPPYKDIIQQ